MIKLTQYLFHHCLPNSGTGHFVLDSGRKKVEIATGFVSVASLATNVVSQTNELQNNVK